MRTKTITDEDLKNIKKIDKVRKEQRKQVVEGDLETYTTMLLGNGSDTKSIFENTAKRQDILLYMMVLTSDMLNGQSSSITLPSAALTNRCHLWQTFQR